MASLSDAVARPRVIINTDEIPSEDGNNVTFNRPLPLADAIEKPPETTVAPKVQSQPTVSTDQSSSDPEPSKVQAILDKLFGLHGQERYQLWPEKLARDALAAPHDVMTGQIPQYEVDPVTGEAHTSTAMIKAAQDVSALAGTGGLAGAGGEASMAIGSGPLKQAVNVMVKSNPHDVNVYHGTNKAFDKFELGKNHQGSSGARESAIGHWFTDNPETASSFADWADRGLGGANVIPAELKLKNPLVVKNYNEIRDLVDKHTIFEKPNYEIGGRQIRMKGDKVDYDALRKELIDKGHDGIVLKDTLTDSPDGKTPINQYVAFAPNTVKSKLTGQTLLSDNEASLGVGALAQTNKPFYSAVENAVAAAKQPKADAQQWLSFLKNQPGVKQEELQHLGLDKLNGSITKDDLLKAVQEGQPQIKEVIKGTAELDKAQKELETAIGNGIPWGKGKLYSDEIIRGLVNEDLGVGDLPSHLQPLARNLLKANKENIPTKYHSYQLPGGENYREMLLTLPDKQKRLYEWEYFDPKTQTSKQFKTEAEAKAAAPEGAIVNQKEVAELNPAYKSSHWDEPNVLAHIRMNDRMIDGKKSLHLEEIQSDWHQEGRKKGYDSAEERAKLLKDLPEGYKVEEFKVKKSDPTDTGLRYRVINPQGGRLSGEHYNKDSAVNSVLNRLNDQIRNKDGSPVPDAPFKKTWDELALKKALTEAVKNGYDQISWTPGEAQAARYDLSKSIREVRYDPKTKQFSAWEINQPKGVGPSILKTVEPDKLSDTIGKDAAEKLLQSKVNEQGDHILEGQDLKVGGQGMKAFYDKMLVDKMNALTKKYGGKVTQSELPPKLSNKMGEPPIKQPVHVLKITPELREHVLKKGFPLFASAPIFTPVSHNPFEKDKQ